MALFRFNANTNKLVPITSEGNIGLPVGAVVAFASGTANENWLECDGSTFDQYKYSALYTYLGTNVLPDYRNRFLEGVGEGETVGTNKEAGLPNITGSQSSGGYGIAQATFDGALYVASTSSSGFAGGGSNVQRLGFDASRSNSIYGKSTTVQPASTLIRWCIKATSAGIEVDKDLYATKGYVSGWTDITSDWVINYSSAGTPTLEKVLWRPSTQELKVIVNAHGISVPSESTFSITVTYNGTDQTIVNMKNNPFDHAASIMPTNPEGTYQLRFIQGCISYGVTLPEFYGVVRNVLSAAGTLEHIVYHITL